MTVDRFAYSAAAICALVCAVAALRVSRGRGRIYGALFLMAVSWAQLCGYYPDPLDTAATKDTASEVLAGIGGCLGIVVGRLLVWEAQASRSRHDRALFSVTAWEVCAAIFIGQIAVPHTLLVSVLDLIGVHVRPEFTRSLFVTASILVGFISLWCGMWALATKKELKWIAPTIAVYMAFEVIFAGWHAIPSAWAGMDHAMPDWLKIAFGVTKLVLTLEIAVILNAYTARAHGSVETIEPPTADVGAVAAI